MGGRVYPRSAKEFDDVEQMLEQNVFVGAGPDEPIIGPGATVVTMGSCFAENIGRSLARANLEVVVNRLHEEANSPMANAALLDYLMLREQSAQAHLFNGHIKADAIDRILRPIAAAHCLIFTVGVGITGFDKRTGKMVLTPNTRELRHMNWVFPSQADQEEFLATIVAQLRQIKPRLPLVITLSPVPLYRSITSESPFVEDCVSKSILRAAIHSLMQRQIPDLYYWPSFEAFRWMGSHTGPVYGKDDDLPRHVNNDLVDLVTRSFMRKFAGLEPGLASAGAKPQVNTLVPDV